MTTTTTTTRAQARVLAQKAQAEASGAADATTETEGEEGGRWFLSPEHHPRHRDTFHAVSVRWQAQLRAALRSGGDPWQQSRTRLLARQHWQLQQQRAASVSKPGATASSSSDPAAGDATTTAGGGYYAQLRRDMASGHAIPPDLLPLFQPDTPLHRHLRLHAGGGDTATHADAAGGRLSRMHRRTSSSAALGCAHTDAESTHSGHASDAAPPMQPRPLYLDLLHSSATDLAQMRTHLARRHHALQADRLQGSPAPSPHEAKPAGTWMGRWFQRSFPSLTTLAATHDPGPTPEDSALPGGIAHPAGLPPTSTEAAFLPAAPKDPQQQVADGGVSSFALGGGRSRVTVRPPSLVVERAAAAAATAACHPPRPSSIPGPASTHAPSACSDEGGPADTSTHPPSGVAHAPVAAALNTSKKYASDRSGMWWSGGGGGGGGGGTAGRPATPASNVSSGGSSATSAAAAKPGGVGATEKRGIPPPVSRPPRLTSTRPGYRKDASPTDRLARLLRRSLPHARPPLVMLKDAADGKWRTVGGPASPLTQEQLVDATRHRADAHLRTLLAACDPADPGAAAAVRTTHAKPVARPTPFSWGGGHVRHGSGTSLASLVSQPSVGKSPPGRAAPARPSPSEETYARMYGREVADVVARLAATDLQA